MRRGHGTFRDDSWLGISHHHQFTIVLMTTLLCEMLEQVLSSDDYHQEDAMKRARRMAKPWILRNLQLGSTMTLPITPVSLLVLFISILYLLSFLKGGKKSYVEASHILLTLQDHPNAPQLMAEWQRKIGKDAQLFAKVARENSACPSKQQGGNLGRFGRHEMAPTFDQVCFDPQTPLQTTVGPVQTPFGYHLIYIHARQESE